MSRGTFKYRCAECGSDSWFNKVEIIRAAGLKCTACGSRFIDAVTKHAKDSLTLSANAKTDFDEARDRKMGKAGA